MTHTEIPNTAADLLELLHNMGENGLHIRELARLNDLSGGFCNQRGLRFTMLISHALTPSKAHSIALTTGSKAHIGLT